MERPDYTVDSEPSVDTWAEACAISQEWADGARLAATKRRFRVALLSLVLMMLLIAAAVAFVLISTGTVNP
jgi:hypothetical protein